MPWSFIPIYPPPKPTTLRVHVPDPSANLFQRIIRNPTNPNRPMRERSCAEMLCVVLLNCPQLRTAIFEQLAELCGWQGLPLSELHYDIETEQAVGGKRDDLRIVGYENEDQTGAPVLLWTIEIKVQAGIHDSSHESYGEEDQPQAEVAVSVTQLENYDRWLETQAVAADRKAGIVLSIPSHAHQVDDLIQAGKLQPRWHCLRWSDLGRWIEDQLAAETLPPHEKVFAEHLLGFLLKFLQDPSEMNDHRIDIEDLALIRAYAQQGKACASRIHSLVSPLLQVFADSKIAFEKVAHQKALFRPSVRSVVWGYLVANGKRKPVPELCLWAGVHRDRARVWIEVSPNSPISSQVRSAIAERIGPLQARDPDWAIPAPEESAWRVVHISKPLAWLLMEEDQAGALAEFVRVAVEDLKQAGVVDALQLIGATDA
ncbi:hypothetical protein [Blastopirellula marina]|uniref:PD-(D/E)XK nuclease superfamily protein n=1 Tax=Blastopirellula marina DSM 3645 TaxID=314230 RepID=A3ZXK5_9BACT|nr:hypothetical protein [Blastopirellula marina]EAQ78800.1 hypothetical protein DSM3645_29901 [Blastopirellula marina DSM 3645]